MTLEETQTDLRPGSESSLQILIDKNCCKKRVRAAGRRGVREGGGGGRGWGCWRKEKQGGEEEWFAELMTEFLFSFLSVLHNAPSEHNHHSYLSPPSSLPSCPLVSRLWVFEEENWDQFLQAGFWRSQVTLKTQQHCGSLR